MFPNPDELHYFIEVAKTKNISRAAERLGIRQPSLSAAIKRLEKYTGSELIIREKTGIHLTRSGLRFLVSAQKLINNWAELKNIVSRENEEAIGHFTIGCHNSIALYMLPQLLNDFTSNFPAIELTFHHALSRQVTEAIISRKIDIGIVVNPVKHPDLVIARLFNDKVSFWHNSSKLKSTDLLILNPSLTQTDWLLKTGKTKQIYKRYFKSENLEFITKLTCNGIGVGIIPGRVARTFGGTEISWITTNQPFYLDEVCIIYRREATNSRGARELIEAIRQADYSQI